jgi:hypothetical protein
VPRPDIVDFRQIGESRENLPWTVQRSNLNDRRTDVRRPYIIGSIGDWKMRENVMYCSRVVSFTSAVALACLAISLLAMSPAGAHQAPTGWTYPWACCSNLDCQEVDAKAISEKPQGYVIQSTGEVVAYGDKRVKNSPDGEYHWCAHSAGMDAGHTICLFVPPRGF